MKKVSSAGPSFAIENDPSFLPAMVLSKSKAKLQPAGQIPVWQTNGVRSASVDFWIKAKLMFSRQRVIIPSRKIPVWRKTDEYKPWKKFL